MKKSKEIDIYNEDCLKILSGIRNETVDLILTDPPYNISKYSTGNINFSNRKAINNDLAEWDEQELDIKSLSDEFTRIIKPSGNIFIFTSYNLLGKWHENLDPLFDTFQFVVWHKTNPTPKFLKAGFLNSCELIICMWNKGHTWNFKKQNEMHNFIESPICMRPERLNKPFHPTQKPVGILKHIIEIATNEGDLVLDPFMGVGSTGVASLELNRRFLGIEIDPTYFNGAKERLAHSQISLSRDNL